MHKILSLHCFVSWERREVHSWIEFAWKLSRRCPSACSCVGRNGIKNCQWSHVRVTQRDKRPQKDPHESIGKGSRRHFIHEAATEKSSLGINETALHHVRISCRQAPSTFNNLLLPLAPAYPCRRSVVSRSSKKEKKFFGMDSLLFPGLAES